MQRDISRAVLAFTVLIGICLIASGCQYLPKLELRISKNPDFNQVTYATLSYTSVAKSCSHEEFLSLKSSLVEFFNFQEQKNMLTLYGKLIWRYPDTWIDEGMEEYRRRPMISCAESRQYYRPLMTAVQTLVLSN